MNEIKTKLRPLYDAALEAVSKGGNVADINALLTEKAIAALRPPRYDLTQYRLCLPVNAAGEASGLAAYVDPAPPPVIAQPFFTVMPESVVMTCPDSGARTKSAKYPRTELQSQKEYSVTEYSRHPFKLLVRSAGTRMSDGIKMVNAQFHCGEFPMMKLALRRKKAGFTMYALVKALAEAGTPDTSVPIADDVPFDVIQDLLVEFFPAANGLPPHLRFTIGGAPLALVEVNYPPHLRFSPHCGVYMQSNKGLGDVATVEFFK